MKFIKLRSIFEKNYLDENLKSSRLCPVISYDEETSIFLCDDGYAGFFFVCEPISGFDEHMQESINSIFNQDYPPNTIFQFFLFKSPDINEELFETSSLRHQFNQQEYENKNAKFLNEAINERNNFFNNHTKKFLINSNQNGRFNLGLINNAKLYISVKFPIKNIIPNDEEVRNLQDWKIRLISAFKQARLQPILANASAYIYAMNMMLNWEEHASWKSNGIRWKDTEPINEQLFDYTTQIDISEKYLKVGEQYVGCLSAKHFPELTYFGSAISYIGDLAGKVKATDENYAVVMNIIIPDQIKERSNFNRKRQYAVNQSDGALQRYIPILKDKRDAFDAMYESLKGNNKIVQANYTVIVFAPSKERLNTAMISTQSYWRAQEFEIMEDRFVHLPLFINCLPLCTDIVAKKDLFRYKTLSSEQVSALLPIMSEWKGTGIPHLALISRNGQLMSMSLHGVGTNSNAVIAAQSGSGKSFLVNEIIMSYLSEGAQVWVIDVGRSYEKLCNLLDGDFIHFGSDTKITFNPFGLISNLEEDEDTLVELVREMASPQGTLEEFQLARLKKIVGQLYIEKNKNTMIDDVAQKCLNDEDPRIKDIGSLLHAFTQEGNYGKYFSNENTVNFNKQFTVLELDDLQGRQHLRQVVLLMLIFQIQQAVYFGDRNVKKIVIIDEAWDLLGSGETAVFMEHAYRKFRKYGGSVLISTQSINDLYSNKHGQAIAENSASMFLLGQKSESIEAVRQSKRLVLPEAAFNMLKGVHTVPGVYSEIFVNTQNAGMGIGRLVVGDFQKLLYSTNPKDVADIKYYQEQGLSLIASIHQVLRSRSH